jgi:hypothetical protein
MDVERWLPEFGELLMKEEARRRVMFDDANDLLGLALPSTRSTKSKIRLCCQPGKLLLTAGKSRFIPRFWLG